MQEGCAQGSLGKGFEKGFREGFQGVSVGFRGFPTGKMENWMHINIAFYRMKRNGEGVSKRLRVPLL